MYKKLEIESILENLRIVEKAIDEISAKIGVKQEDYGKILVTTMEAVNNAIVHGNKSVVNKLVVIEMKFEKETLSISVSDEGPGFKPKEVPDPTQPENIENLNGRGVFLMFRLADEISFNEQGNKVTMCFKNVKT
jgi:serine/threonine-protein kinase RsbW